MVSLPLIQHFCPSNFRCPNMLPRLLLRCPGSITQHEPILHPEAAVTPWNTNAARHGTPAFSAFSGPSLIQVQLSTDSLQPSPITLQPPPVILWPHPQLHYSLLQLHYSPLSSYTIATLSGFLLRTPTHTSRSAFPLSLPTFLPDSRLPLCLFSFPSATSLTFSQAYH